MRWILTITVITYLRKYNLPLLIKQNPKWHQNVILFINEKHFYYLAYSTAAAKVYLHVWLISNVTSHSIRINVLLRCYCLSWKWYQNTWISLNKTIWNNSILINIWNSSVSFKKLTICAIHFKATLKASPL